jgi:biopolymer transport protein ExbD
VSRRFREDPGLKEPIDSNVLAAIHQAEPDRNVIVRGDRRLQYEKVSEVLTTLSDVGFNRIRLVTEGKAS